MTFKGLLSTLLLVSLFAQSAVADEIASINENALSIVLSEDSPGNYLLTTKSSNSENLALKTFTLEHPTRVVIDILGASIRSNSSSSYIEKEVIVGPGGKTKSIKVRVVDSENNSFANEAAKKSQTTKKANYKVESQGEKSVIVSRGAK